MTIQTTPETHTTGSGAAPIVTETPVIVENPIVVPEPAPTAAPEGTPEPTSPPAPVIDPNKTPDWAQKRINELTAKRYEADRLAQDAADREKAAQRRIAELLKQVETGTGTPPVGGEVLAETEIEKRATEKAKMMAQANEFNRACNNIVDVGKKEYKDTWDQAVANLTMVGAIGKDVSPEFLENTIELKDPHKILHYLGTHMDEGARIAGLSGRKQAMELARIEASLNAPVVVPPTPISGAPAPIIPVGGAAGKVAPSIDDPNTSSEDWYKLRQAQVLEKRNRYN